MSEISNRQCIYCRRTHPLGYCAYGISNGRIDEHKLAKLEGRKSKGNPAKKRLSTKKREMPMARTKSFKQYMKLLYFTKIKVNGCKKWVKELPF